MLGLDNKEFLSLLSLYSIDSFLSLFRKECLRKNKVCMSSLVHELDWRGRGRRRILTIEDNDGEYKYEHPYELNCEELGGIMYVSCPYEVWSVSV